MKIEFCAHATHVPEPAMMEFDIKLGTNTFESAFLAGYIGAVKKSVRDNIDPDDHDLAEIMKAIDKTTVRHVALLPSSGDNSPVCGVALLQISQACEKHGDHHAMVYGTFIEVRDKPKTQGLDHIIDAFTKSGGSVHVVEIDLNDLLSRGRFKI